MKNFIVVTFLLMATSLFGQNSLTVMQGDVIELHATQVTTLAAKDGLDAGGVPDGDILLYHIHILYEDGFEEQIKHNDPMQFPSGANIIVEANATGMVGTHIIEAWSVRIKPTSSGGENNIAAQKTILTLTVEANIDNRPPAKWIIIIQPKTDQ